MEIVIYLLDWTAQGGKQYIGQTMHFTKRMREHANNKSSGLVPNAFLEFGDPDIRILHITSDSEKADALEILEIEGRNTKIPNGYNIDGGGHIHKKRGPAIHFPRKLLASFTQEDYDKLAKIATKKNLYVTQLLREIVREYLYEPPKPPEEEWDPFNL